jgi:AcrR family transcriptional regulator
MLEFAADAIEHRSIEQSNMAATRTRPRSIARRNAATGPSKPRQKRVLRLPHGEGREALLEAVVRSVVRHGPKGLSNRVVAREAGVSHSLVRYHFGSRDKMLTETYRWVVSGFFGSLGIQPKATWLDDWAKGIAAMTEDDEAAHLFMNEMTLDAYRSAEHRELVLPVFRRVFRQIGEANKAAGLPTAPALVRVIFAIMIGLTMQHLVFRDLRIARESAEEFARILRSLAKPATG